MAVKAKATKAKALAKKSSSLRPKKKEISVKDAYHEADAEQLELAQEALPKRGVKAKTAEKDKEKETTKEKKILHDKEKVETKSIVVEDKPVKGIVTTAVSAPEIIAPITPRVVLNKPVQASPNPIQSQNQNQNQNQNQIQNQEARSERPREEARQHQPQQNQNQNQNQSSKQQSNDGLKVRLSESLVKKLKEQAADEGISLEEFVAELLAESVVLRAWEIVERKNAMKGHSGQGQGPMGGGRNYNNQGGGNKGGPNSRGPGGGGQGQGQGQGGGNKGHRGMSHVRYQSIMDDKATFLEYVRNQEKTRR